MNIPPIVLFDGVCNLCNWSLQYFHKYEKNNAHYFASLQSEAAQYLIKKNVNSNKPFTTIVYIKKGKAYVKSTAALMLTKSMRGIFPVFQVFLWVPAPVRDWVYDIIARNRYKWFGKQTNCMVPDTTLKSRFLETVQDVEALVEKNH